MKMDFFVDVLYKLFVTTTAVLFLSACSGGGKGEESPKAPAVSSLPSIIITSPTTRPLVTNQNTLNVTGLCIDGATVSVDGDSSASTTCSGTSFTLTLAASTEATFTYNFKEFTSTSDMSNPTTLQWTRDITPPSTLSITAPVANPYFSNNSSITITGTCEIGARVNISGDMSGSQICTSGTFSFTDSQSTDQTYNYLLTQTDPAGNTSNAASVVWRYDTAAPLAPVITSPVANPYISAESLFSLTGTCENNATVNLTGDTTNSILCAGNAFSFPISTSVDGTYNYSIIQTDQAGNISPSRSFQWTRDTTIPSTPIITSPVNPYFSNLNSVTINGICTAGYTVEISGDVTNSTTCSVGGSFSFTVNQTADATYNYLIIQKNLALQSSGAVSFSWTHDSVAPSVPVITSPVGSPFHSNTNTLNVAGNCEANATVNITGSSIATASCDSSGNFSLSLTQSLDGTYNYTFTQTDKAGNTSVSTAISWIVDTAGPTAPTITNHLSPYLSNANSLTISGACEINSSVQISGDYSSSTTCTTGTYSFTTTKLVDNSYNFTLNQTDLSGNTSANTAFTWQRDTTAPSAPAISNPATSPYTSAGNLSVNGSCETGATVNLTGNSTSSIICSAGTFNFTINKSSDATYNFSFTQTDPAGNTSSSTAQQWVRDSSTPGSPVITFPATSPYTSNGSSLMINGTCVSGYTVEISGDATNSTVCSSNTFSFSVSASLDAIYNFDIVQKNLSGIYSAVTTVSWIRDTVAPSAPTISLPTSNPYYSNGNLITMTGSCENLASVHISGAASATTTCSSNSYSVSLSKLIDGNYSYSVAQTDPAGNTSNSVTQNWIRDTLAPATVTLSRPTSNPFVSGDTNLSITGGCESFGETVTLSSASGTATTTCSAVNTYNFSISKNTDGIYNYTITQTDFAANTSSAYNFQWTRDTSIPFTPLILAPSAAVFYSNANTITITASCDSSLTPSVAVVNLSGDVIAGEVTSPVGSLSQNCTSSPVTFVVQKTIDGNFNFYINQDNPNAATTSANSSVQWVRDTASPNAPSITNPSASPFTAPGNLTLAGDCEANSTLNLTGSDAQSQTCSPSGTYSFVIIKSLDATYNFNLSQTDRAGNTSTTTLQQWIRDSNSVPPPTITSPMITPYKSNSTTLTMTGVCNTGYLVTIGGAGVTASNVTSPANSLTQICSGGLFSYSLLKTTDATYALTLKQTFNAIDSSLTNFSWILDTTAPTTTITSAPSATNLTVTATFAFSANELGSTFQCKTDSGLYTSCTSPKIYTGLSNSSHTFYVIATDTAGNISTERFYTWTQAAYNTIALYHLNSAGPTTDSSSFTQVAGYNNSLTASGTPANDTTGVYPTGSASSRSFGTGINYFSNDNNTQDLGNSTMTIEGFVKLSATIGTTGNYYTLISKTGSASPDYGWELRLKKATSSKYALDFVGSLTGTTVGTTVSSTNFSLSTGTWYYFAATWNKGTVNFYFGTTATSRGSKTIGTVGSAVLATTAAPLRLGSNATSGSGTSLWLSGSLDEVRFSQVVRTVSKPTTEYTAD